MKKIFIILVLTSISVFTFVSCSSTVNNGITFQNLASGDVHVNFLAKLTTVKSGETVELTSLPKGTFTYSTTYQVPGGLPSEADGDVAGEMVLKAGTKILVVYSSIIVEGIYKISATKSSSDDINDEGDPNPVGP